MGFCDLSGFSPLIFVVSVCVSVRDLRRSRADVTGDDVVFALSVFNRLKISRPAPPSLNVVLLGAR